MSTASMPWPSWRPPDRRPVGAGLQATVRPPDRPGPARGLGLVALALVLWEPDQGITVFTSPLDAFEGVLTNERTVTRQINALYRLALEHGDYPAQILLQWFVQEQVEEEKSAQGVVGRLTLAGDNAGAVLLIDQELGARPAEPDGPGLIP